MRGRRLLVGVTVLGALAACGGDDAGGGGASSAPVDTGVVVTSPAGNQMVVDVDKAPGSDPTAESGDDDTELTSCTNDAGRWQAAGTSTNPTDATVDYRIYITFMNGNEIQAIVQADATGVAPGATADWVDGYDSSAEGLTCIVRVERVASAAT